MIQVNESVILGKKVIIWQINWVIEWSFDKFFVTIPIISEKNYGLGKSFQIISG